MTLGEFEWRFEGWFGRRPDLLGDLVVSGSGKGERKSSRNGTWVSSEGRGRRGRRREELTRLDKALRQGRTLLIYIVIFSSSAVPGTSKPGTPTGSQDHHWLKPKGHSPKTRYRRVGARGIIKTRGSLI